MRSKLLAALLLFTQLGWGIPADAQSRPYQNVHIQVYVYNMDDGSPVPALNVFYEETGGQYCSGTRPFGQSYIMSGESGGNGVADFTVEACPGEAVIHVNSSQFFRGNRVAISIGPGQQFLTVRVPLEPIGQSTKLQTNKYLNPQTRTLHIRVRGRQPNGKLVPVHYATIYDRHGRHVATTDYNGMATAQVKEVMGETVTLTADATHWGQATGSFIVGASEGGTRLTRADDYVNITMNGGEETREEIALEVFVRGAHGSKTIPVGSARISDAQGHYLMTTDVSGHAKTHVNAPFGETYTIKIDAGAHWKPATHSFEAGSRSGASNVVRVVLEPAQPYKELTVEVLNRETDKPMPGVTVTLYKPSSFPGKVIAHEATNAEGLATFDSSAVEEALLNGEARLGAAHGSVKPAMQTFAGSLMEGESPKYVLYVTETQEKTKWSGTWYSGQTTIQVSGGNGSLGFQALRSEGAGTCCPLVDQSSGSCTVKGNTATCTYHGQYSDSAKKVQYGGHATLVLSGNYISTKWHQDTGSITLTEGVCPDIAQCTGLHPGAEFTGTWTRQKP